MKKILTIILFIQTCISAQTLNNVCVNAVSSTATIDVGPDPRSTTCADFNNDGNLDLAVTNTGANLISVLFGNGTGSFASPVTYSMYNPANIIHGDFNGDGNIDLAVAGISIYVLLGSVSGTFSTPINYNGFSFYPISLTSSDYNTDGKDDIAVADYNLNAVHVLLSNNTNSFSPVVSYTVGTHPISIANADLNGDGNMDLAVANTDSYNISMLFGSSSGTFTMITNYGICGTCDPYNIISDDFNGDGKADLAVTAEAQNNLYILLGSGTGSIVSNTSFPVGNGFTAGQSFMICRDMDLDGKKDLVIGNREYNISILIGVGAGSFMPAIHYEVGQIFEHIASGDFNNDGKFDIAVPCILSGMYILLNPGAGIFNTAKNYPTNSYPIDITSSDFNGDGNKDIAVVHEGPNDIIIYLGSSSGTFVAAGTFNNVPGLYPSSITNADYNNDGKMDMAVANNGSNNVSLYLGLGTGSFALPSYYSVGQNPTSITSADFNSDAKMDLAISNGTTNNVSILLGTGTGSFSTATNYSVGTNPVDILSKDVNNDGKIDLITANANSDDISVLIATGSGSFLTASNYSVGAKPIQLTSGDFNGDGKIDLAVANFNSYNIQILIGTGAGTYSAGASYSLAYLPLSLSSADYNGDSKTDIALVTFQNSFLSRLTFLLGSGNGTFLFNDSYRVGYTAKSFISEDFDADLIPDLAVINYQTFYLTVFKICNPMTVSVTDNRNEVNNLFSIYPNPARESITIRSDKLQSTALIQVINSLGNVVSHSILFNGEANINIQSLVPGLYFVRLFTDSGISATSKIIKN